MPALGSYGAISARAWRAVRGVAILPSAAALNPAISAANITFSNSNRTIVAATGGAWKTALSVTGRSAGKYYAETKVGLIAGGGGLILGINDSSANGTDVTSGRYPGSLTGSVGYECGAGKMDAEGVNGYLTGASAAVGGTVGVALDASTGKIWFSVNGVYQNGDPAAGTGGYTFSGPTRAFRLSAAVYAVGDKQIINTGFLPYVHNPPTGFGAWG